MIKSDEYQVRVTRAFPPVHNGDVLDVPKQLQPAKAARLLKGGFVEMIADSKSLSGTNSASSDRYQTRAGSKGPLVKRSK